MDLVSIQIGAVRVGRWVVVKAFIVAAVVVGVLALGLEYVTCPSLVCAFFRLNSKLLKVIKEGELLALLLCVRFSG